MLYILSLAREMRFYASLSRGFVVGSSDGQRWNSYTTNGLNNITVNSFAIITKPYIGTAAVSTSLTHPLLPLPCEKLYTAYRIVVGINAPIPNERARNHSSRPAQTRTSALHLHNALGQEVALWLTAR